MSIKNTPNNMAATKTVLNEPTIGKFILLVLGLTHIWGITPSNPNILPYNNPNMAEVNPAADKIAAKGIFFIRYTIKPMANMHNPCPKSPNIAPKRSE